MNAASRAGVLARPSGDQLGSKASMRTLKLSDHSKIRKPSRYTPKSIISSHDKRKLKSFDHLFGAEMMALLMTSGRNNPKENDLQGIN